MRTPSTCLTKRCDELSCVQVSTTNNHNSSSTRQVSLALPSSILRRTCSTATAKSESIETITNPHHNNVRQNRQRRRGKSLLLRGPRKSDEAVRFPALSGGAPCQGSIAHGETCALLERSVRKGGDSDCQLALHSHVFSTRSKM